MLSVHTTTHALKRRARTTMRVAWPLSFYRNKAYHGRDDTADRLDYEPISKVVVAVFEAMRSI